MAATKTFFSSTAETRPQNFSRAFRGHIKGHPTLRPIEFPYSLTQFTNCKRKSNKLNKGMRRPLTALVKNMLELTALDLGASVFKATATVNLRKSKMDRMKETASDWLEGLSRNKQSTESEGCVTLQLISMETNPGVMVPRLSQEAVMRWPSSLLRGEEKKLSYRVEFTMDTDFGMPGAMLVGNEYNEEFFLESINFEGIVQFQCNSWVQPLKVHPKKRIFFSNKAYLPSKTPRALQLLREKELLELRGDGSGQRKLSDRIYDYDVYNDLGDPDKGTELARPTLGGAKNPHPRRCRTGRTPTKTDPNAESRVNDHIPMYVPRDEQLAESKKEDLKSRKLKGMLRNVIPYLRETFNPAFSGYTNISNFYKERPFLLTSNEGSCRRLSLPLSNAVKKTRESLDDIFKFDPPRVSNDTFILRDDEFGRQAIAGMNPLNIEKLTAFPPRSKLDPFKYGPQESALKEEHILGNLNGMSVQQAIDANKLFIIDYHDLYMPFLDLINSQRGRKAHATRTIFFLTDMGTLKPIAIELSQPPDELSSLKKQVLVPPVDATTSWLWQLGKAHVCANDAGIHQLVNHWLRTHACLEPFIIAAHRQLSVMHPIHKLLLPHMKDTLSTNAMARETLITSGGIIENDFTPGRYCMQLSCAAYRDWWRFDLEGLPADLIRRGVATPDPSQTHGLRMLIEDYPYANDGLLIWSGIEELVQTYVNYYYTDADEVKSDRELQGWYDESINVGHADHCHASWWPKLHTPEDLSSILTILIWLTTAQHAALNFGQYPYGGYVPHRPPLLRRLVPNEHDPEYKNFLADPQGFFLSSLPSLLQATKFTAVLDILSAHPPDEEYIGQRDLSVWSGDPEIIKAFYKFSTEMKTIEQLIKSRNANPKLRNRCGAGVAPYELLLPSSGPGVTSRGIPNSITM